MMKIAAFLITALINGGVGVFLFFFLLLSLNGFSESQATPGLILYIVWVLLASIATAVFSFLLTKYLITKKSLSGIVAALISIVSFILIGTGSTFVAMFAAIFLVSAMR